jgi:hypothetical protein
MKRLGIFSALFIFLALPVKAQDTIYCPDNRYYWNNENCNNIRGATITTQPHNISHWWYVYRFSPIDSVAISRNINKPVVLKRIIFPKDSLKERTVYGIAGTATACGNPNGCYFYLCKKIGTNYVVIDSAEWTHNGGEYNYVHYQEDTTGATIGQTNTNPLPCYPTFSDLTGAPPMLPSGEVPAYEAYFRQPITISDTFYIGMNPNFVPRQFGHNKSSSNWTWPISDSSRFSFSFYALYDGGYSYDEDLYLTYFPFDSSYIGEYSHGGGSRGFFPIMEPPSFTCPPVTRFKADSITYNSAYIHWEQSLRNTYCQMEYGKKGFQHGTGVFVDSITQEEMWLNNLETNTRYDVYVRAYCEAEDTVTNWGRVSFQTFDTTCASVTNLATVYVQDKLARISWEITDSVEVGNCEMEWGMSGFNLGSGTRISYLLDTTYLLRNLQPNTVYDVYVRTYCPRSKVYSPWIKMSFATETSGIMEAESSPIEVHPNPTTGIVEITLPQGYENKEVHLYNIHGTLLQTKQAQAAKLSFDLSAYSDGVYIIKIDNYSTRIVKTK